jgi:hypothetical protein
MNYRENTLLDSTGAPRTGYTVTVYPVGAEASATSSDTTVPVYAGHSFRNSDKVLKNPGTDDTYGTVTTAAAQQLTMSGSFSVADGDQLVNLGADTGSSSPAYDASPVSIYSDPAATNAISNSRVTTDSSGKYSYYTRGDGKCWELIRDASGTLVDVIAGWSSVGGRLNLADYACAIDNSTNDAAGLQAAVLAMETLGAELFHPGGTCVLGTQTALTGNANIVGAGMENSVFKISAAVIGLYFDAASAKRATLRDFTVDGNSTGQLSAGLIDFDDNYHFIMERVRIHSAGDGTDDPDGVNGIAIGSSTSPSNTTGVIRDCEFHGCDKAPINWSSNGQAILIDGCKVYSNSGNGSCPGIQLNGAENARVVNNEVYGNEGIGITATTGPADENNGRLVISGNIVYDNADSTTSVSAGIFVGRGAAETGRINAIIANNQVYNNGDDGDPDGYGIYLNNVDLGLVTGNQVFGNGNSGIFLDGDGGAVEGINLCVVGNMCWNNNQGGLSGANGGIALRGVSRVLVADNMCFDNQGTPTQDFGIFLDDPVSDQIRILDNILYANDQGDIGYDTYPTNSSLQGVFDSASQDYFMVSADADPQIVITEALTTADSLILRHRDSGVGDIRVFEASGAAQFDLDAIPSDGSSNSTVSFHRNTTTTGITSLRQIGEAILGVGVTAGITASVTQTQGQQPLVSSMNEVSTVANTNDTVTLPTAQAGFVVAIDNNGANTLQIFPASGDAINGGSVNASVTLAAGSKALYIAYDTTNWSTFV